jgi:hypothetical protein
MPSSCYLGRFTERLCVFVLRRDWPADQMLRIKNNMHPRPKPALMAPKATAWPREYLSRPPTRLVRLYCRLDTAAVADYLLNCVSRRAALYYLFGCLNEGMTERDFLSVGSLLSVPWFFTHTTFRSQRALWFQNSMLGNLFSLKSTLIDLYVLKYCSCHSFCTSKFKLDEIC